MGTEARLATSAVAPGAVRLGGTASQRAFRVLLDALTRPGTIQQLPPGLLPTEVPPALVVPLALADVEVAVAVLGDPDSRWARLVLDATGARPAPSADADVVVALVAPGTAEVGGWRRGTDESPEGGARVAVACTDLHPGTDHRRDDARHGGADHGTVWIELRGPGVDGVRVLGIDGLPATVLGAVADANARFPRGIDVWLATTDGRVVGLPRSTRVRVLDEEGR